MRPLKDYSFIQGFNYTQSNVWTDVNMWDDYDHGVVDRDMGYAQRLGLNSARVFLTYASYVKNKAQFLANVKDFTDTAWAHGISVNPIIYHGFRFHPDDQNFRRNWKPGQPMPIAKTLLDPSCWHLGEVYFDDLYETIGRHPGLLFWDISNEPGYRIRTNNCTWYEDEPAWMQEGQPRPEGAELEELRYRQKLVWDIVQYFCKYVKAKDPENAIGVGHTFIYETEPSGTAELVDIIVFHDYAETRSRVRAIYDQAKALGEKYGKPVLNNETGCLCRSNPYEMILPILREYKFGFHLFELMVGEDGWNRVHGIVYPNGTVRDPSIVSALLGFYRNRDDSAIYPDVNQEGHAEKALALARSAVLHAKRRIGPAQGRRTDPTELLEACEYIANLLECGEHIAMACPPTAKIAAFRRQENPDIQQILDYLYELSEVLKKACHLI